jgi:hypothetical protein
MTSKPPRMAVIKNIRKVLEYLDAPSGIYVKAKGKSRKLFQHLLLQVDTSRGAHEGPSSSTPHIVSICQRPDAYSANPLVKLTVAFQQLSFLFPERKHIFSAFPFFPFVHEPKPRQRTLHVVAISGRKEPPRVLLQKRPHDTVR